MAADIPDPPAGEAWRAGRRAVVALDVTATAVFAVGGGLAGVRAGLDVLGVMVVAFATALAGGIVRDVLLGDLPPAAVTHRWYAIVALSAGATVFCLHYLIEAVPVWVVTGLDAAGLGLFAVSGADKALARGVSPLMAILLGGITGAGGGTVRDVLLGTVPSVLRVDLYAVAALLGATVVAVGARLGSPRAATMAAGAACCVVLRVLAAWQDWSLPHA